MGPGVAILGTGRDFDYVNWEASRWRLAALLTPPSYVLNLGGFGATIRRHRFLGVAMRCEIGLPMRDSLLAVAHGCCALRPEWCQRWCQVASPTPSFPISLGHPLPRQYHLMPDGVHPYLGTTCGCSAGTYGRS
jgi:hypothetical protein